MTDRDHFAAAALTGLIANGDYSVESTPVLAWLMSDAMLRERAATTEKDSDVPYSRIDEKRGDSPTIRDTTPPRDGAPAEGSVHGECAWQ